MSKCDFNLIRIIISVQHSTATTTIFNINERKTEKVTEKNYHFFGVVGIFTYGKKSTQMKNDVHRMAFRHIKRITTAFSSILNQILFQFAFQFFFVLNSMGIF